MRLLVVIAVLSSALFKPRVCPLHQHAMSPINVATLAYKMEKCWVLHGGGGSKLLPWRNDPLVRLRLVRVIRTFKAAYDKLDSTYVGW